MLPSFAHGAQLQVSAGRDVAKGGQRRRFHIGAGYSRRALGQQIREQSQLGGSVGVQGAMIIQVVASQVGKPSRRDPCAVQAELVQTVRRRLQGGVLHAGAGQPRKAFRQADGIGGGEPGTRREARRDQAQRAEAGGLVTGQGPDLAQEFHGTGLAVGAGDGDDGSGLRSGQQRRDSRQPLAGFAVEQQRAFGHPVRPGGASRGEDRHGAPPHGFGDESAPVCLGPRQRGEQIARHHLSAVGGHAGDVQTGHRAPEGI